MLHIQGLTKQFGSKVLFENTDAHLSHRSRVALIGPNGAGKSTLIKILMGFESPDSGQVSRAKHLAIGYLPQELPKMSGRTVLEEVLRMDGRREELLQAKLELELAFSDTNSEAAHDSNNLDRYGRLVEELENLDEYRIESRAKGILGGMGFKTTDFDRKLSEFSGGWLMRVALSRILLMDPDLLLLDEPTNHLDLESLLWLEEFLRRTRGAMLIISHDTAFLNRTVTEVLEVDQKRLWSYRGNLDAYKVQKAERLQVMRNQQAGQLAKIAEIEDFVSRFGAKATKARQAQSKLKQLDKIELIELPEDRATVRFEFPPAPHSGKDVVSVNHAAVRFGEKTLFRDLNWLIRKGTRTAIVGVNGAGKTTLLKVLSGHLRPSSGDVKLGFEVKVGYYSQMQAETLNMKNTIAQELESAAPDMPISKVRGIAGAFLFSGDAVEKRCEVLSGGEKARVALAKLLLSPSNFLILDEPTNHLDTESRAVLLSALQNYTGTLVLVSHDREFVAPLVDNLLEIEPSPEGSRVIHSTLTYEEYLERKLKEASNSLSGTEDKVQKKESTSPSATSPGALKKGPSNNQKNAWSKEKDQLEALITKLEQDQTDMRLELANPVTYEDKTRFYALIEKQKEIDSTLEKSYARWEEISLALQETSD
jgi:ATP-binding cassette subfamily F protein 3